MWCEVGEAVLIWIMVVVVVVVVVLGGVGSWSCLATSCGGGWAWDLDTDDNCNEGLVIDELLGVAYLFFLGLMLWEGEIINSLMNLNVVWSRCDYTLDRFLSGNGRW